MFDSGDEDAEYFEVGVDDDHRPLPSFNRNQPLPLPPRQSTQRSSAGNTWDERSVTSTLRSSDVNAWQTAQRSANSNAGQSHRLSNDQDQCQRFVNQFQRPVNSVPPQPPRPSNHRYGTTSGPYYSNADITIPEADVDPFIRFPDEIKLNGFIITNEIPENPKEIPRRLYSFMVFCQEDQKIYGIPRRLTTPPNKKLNEVQRWRKKRDLEFGRKVDFILDQYNDVLEYAKGPSDSIIAENIDGKNCFQVQCVLDRDLMKFYCVEFGLSKMRRPLAYHIENLAYDCQVTFHEDAAIQKILHFEIFKVIKASADQSVISTTPWINNLPTTMLTDNEIEELKNPDNYKANVTGLRYANDRVLHLRAENQVKIIFCTDFENLPPIGSIFQFDYVFHPIKKLAVVAAVIRINEHLEVKEIVNGQDDESGFMFEICLDISEHKNGFYHHETLGMITDTKKCLRFAPYRTTQKPSEEIYVRVKACLRQPALFDIVEICENDFEIIEASEPPFVEADCLLINKLSGKVFAHMYPGLDLRLDERICKNFQIGDLLNGRFFLQNRQVNSGDNRYVSDDAVKMNTEPFRVLQVSDDYALIVMKLHRITYTAAVSNKQKKKNPQQAVDIPQFRQYAFFLENYFESTHGGLIGGSKGRVSSIDDYAFSILETCLDGGQYCLNYVCKFDHLTSPLDLDQNIALRNHVSKVMAHRHGIPDDNGSRHSSMSAATISSHSSSSIPSSRSSASIPLPLHDNAENSSRTSTPIADEGRYSELSTRSMNSTSVRSQRFQSPTMFSGDRRTPTDQYSQNGASRNGNLHSRNEYGNERGASRISTTSFATASPASFNSAPVVVDHRSSANIPPTSHEPRHQYEHVENQRFADSSSSRLPPTSTWGRASAQPATGNRIESRADSVNSAPTGRVPSNPAWPSRPASNANIRVEEVRSPEAHYRSNGTSSSRVASNHASQNSLPATNGRVESRARQVDDVEERMSNNEIFNDQPPRRKPFPQLGDPRYRNLCLYRRGENISPQLASILTKMDSYLTNPPPPLTSSIKRTRNETNMPEFEEFVEKYLNI
uniref:Uncharacterized protein n=1 Tax=Panagrolaimus sp. ES5 TaxID=591445 RepID=A0AC34GNL6_9BILA